MHTYVQHNINIISSQWVYTGQLQSITVLCQLIEFGQYYSIIGFTIIKDTLPVPYDFFVDMLHFENH